MIQGGYLLKKYMGQIIFNVVVAAVGAILIGKFGGSAFTSILEIIIMMSVLGLGNYAFISLANSGRKAFQPSYTITENTFDNLNEPKDYIDVMKDLKDYRFCSAEASKVIEQWESFKKKSVTLDAISSHGGVYDVVNQDVESVMLRNMVLFMKRVAIMQSSTKNEALTIHRGFLKGIVQSNEKILNDYTNLLVEASQLTGTDSNMAEIQSLNLLIDSIRDYRKELERGDL